MGRTELRQRQRTRATQRRRSHRQPFGNVTADGFDQRYHRGGEGTDDQPAAWKPSTTLTHLHGTTNLPCCDISTHVVSSERPVSRLHDCEVTNCSPRSRQRHPSRPFQATARLECFTASGWWCPEWQ